MKTSSRRGMLLFGAILMACALVSSLASAASWSPVGTTHQLFSNNLAVTAHNSPIAGLPLGWSCAGSELDADVASANALVVTSQRFSNCTGTGAAADCTVTPVGTTAWTATAIDDTNIQIHNVFVDVQLEGPSPSCVANGAKLILTGTLTSGSWKATSNEMLLTNQTGLAVHYLGFVMPATSSATVSGTIRDTTNTLRMFSEID